MVRSRRHLKLESRKTARERFWSHVDRQTYNCPMCGRTEAQVGATFHVHHRDGDWLNNHALNLVALCPRCHHRLHRMVQRAESLEAWKQAGRTLGTVERNISHSSLYSDD